jgi:hypothetical protein
MTLLGDSVRYVSDFEVCRRRASFWFPVDVIRSLSPTHGGLQHELPRIWLPQSSPSINSAKIHSMRCSVKPSSPGIQVLRPSQNSSTSSTPR